MLKNLTPEVRERLQKKQIAIVDYIYRLREGRGMTLTAMADKMGVKMAYLSRILSGAGSNVTLETIAKCEDALDAEIIVCPGEYEEHLVDNRERLKTIISVAIKAYPTFQSELQGMLHQKNLEAFHALNDGVAISGKAIRSSTVSSADAVEYTVQRDGSTMIFSVKSGAPNSVIPPLKGQDDSHLSNTVVDDAGKMISSDNTSYVKTKTA